MALVIGYASSSAKAQAELDDWDDDRGPDHAAFWLPPEASAGDRIVYFIGRTRQEFVATGRVLSNWRKAGAGRWKGHDYVRVSSRRLVRPPVTAGEMTRLTGLPTPKDAGLVPAHLVPAVEAALRHHAFDPEARALEGARTEAISSKRNPKLRQLALQRANGVCDGCHVDFSTLAGGLGRRCLVVHHKKQLRDTDEPRWTSLTELAVVCANCHMIIHADPAKPLTIRQLQSRLNPGTN